MNEPQRILEAAIASGQLKSLAAVSCTSSGTDFTGAAGTANEDGTTLTAEHIFSIASMTKAVTSVAAMMLVDRGLLALDKPIADWLPALSEPQVLVGFDGDTPLLRPANRPITLRQLLTHSAGHGYTIWDASLKQFRKLQPQARPIPGDNALMSQPLVADPGERWTYSTCTDWVGLAVEAASGQSLGTFFDQNIFAPIGMRDTTFKLSEAQMKRLVRGYCRDDEGNLVPMPPGDGASEERGGGGLFSTPTDYGMFLSACLRELRAPAHEDTPLLSTQSRAGLSQSQFRANNVGELVTTTAQISNTVHFMRDYAPSWTLGFLRNALPVPGRRGAGSLTWGGLNNTYFWLDPANDVAGVLCTQILPFADGPTLEVFERFESAIYAVR